MKNKFIKFLIILNGTLLPLILCFVLYQISKDFFKGNNDSYEQGVILGEELEEAKKDSVALQGLRYYSPNSLYNTENMYLPVSLLTYQEKKRLSKAAASANDFNEEFLKYVNVIFIDKNYKVIRSLVNKKASIKQIEEQRKTNGYNNTEPDLSIKYIAYMIAFEDSNQDGKLNSSDNHDLYLSDLSGGNLKKVTNNIEIQNFEFINSNSQIHIYYVDRNEVREEHKRTKMAIYNIEKGEFKELKSIEAELDKLEKIIIQ